MADVNTGGRIAPRRTPSIRHEHELQHAPYRRLGARSRRAETGSGSMPPGCLAVLLTPRFTSGRAGRSREAHPPPGRRASGRAAQTGQRRTLTTAFDKRNLTRATVVCRSRRGGVMPTRQGDIALLGDPVAQRLSRSSSRRQTSRGTDARWVHLRRYDSALLRRCGARFLTAIRRRSDLYPSSPRAAVAGWNRQARGVIPSLCRPGGAHPPLGPPGPFGPR